MKALKPKRISNKKREYVLNQLKEGSNAEKIFWYLSTFGNTLTQRECTANDFGIALHQRIGDLRGHGCTFDSVLLPDKKTRRHYLVDVVMPNGGKK